MSEQSCKTCQHFRPQRGPTGRALRSLPGFCAWKVHWPEKWPVAFLSRTYGTYGPMKPPTPPVSGGIHSDGGNDCPCHLPIPEKPKRVKPQEATLL